MKGNERTGRNERETRGAERRRGSESEDRRGGPGLTPAAPARDPAVGDPPPPARARGRTGRPPEATSGGTVAGGSHVAPGRAKRVSMGTWGSRARARAAPPQ